MSFLKVSESACIALIPKAGSTFLRSGTYCLMFDAEEISNEDALGVCRRVAFIRPVMDRLVSAFSFIWWHIHHGEKVGLLPDGVIEAFGGRAQGFVGRSSNVWSEKKIARFMCRVDGISDTRKLVRELNQEDWERFVDFILDEKNINDHWNPQSEILKSGGVFVPNELYSISEMSFVLRNEFSIAGYTANSFPHIDIDARYRIGDICGKYAEDINMAGLKWLTP